MAHVLLPSMWFALVTKHDDMCDVEECRDDAQGIHEPR
jgi:hypothetical protein